MRARGLRSKCFSPGTKLDHTPWPVPPRHSFLKQHSSVASNVMSSATPVVGVSLELWCTARACLRPSDLCFRVWNRAHQMKFWSLRPGLLAGRSQPSLLTVALRSHGRSHLIRRSVGGLCWVVSLRRAVTWPSAAVLRVPSVVCWGI